MTAFVSKSLSIISERSRFDCISPTSAVSWNAHKSLEDPCPVALYYFRFFRYFSFFLQLAIMDDSNMPDLTLFNERVSNIIQVETNEKPVEYIQKLCDQRTKSGAKSGAKRRK